jgi:hypothetical protein
MQLAAQNPGIEEMPQDPAMRRAQMEAFVEQTKVIMDRLEKEAADRVSRRQQIEERWLADLRQYNGVYDTATAKNLENDASKSELFINLTRPKTNTCAAKLGDMLFPTDDKNWGIMPTPVPTMSAEAKSAAAQAEMLTQQANEAEAAGQSAKAASLANEANLAARRKHQLKLLMDEAKTRAGLMEDEIDDQLTECNYAEICREVINDACQVGTGIIKGPVASAKRQRQWDIGMIDPETGKTTRTLKYVDAPRPGYQRVDYWGFFPDPDARTIEESESEYERHLMTPKQLKKLAKLPGFDKEAIRSLLRNNPKHSTPTYIADLRNISGIDIGASNNRYQVWEYHGSLNGSEIAALCACLGKSTADYGLAEDSIDPLETVNVVIWFCQGELLKLGIHHLDSGESIYSVYNIEKDSSSIFGFGIPHLMRDPQKAHSAAWRMMLDNAGLSTGPQIEIDPTLIDPVDGNWALTPRKVWKRKATANPNVPAIRTYNIESHQAELANIIALANQFVDDTTFSQIAQGEQGAHTTQTLGGMSMLMNSVNVVFRRMVKNWDDDITTPTLRRIYDWNMQFSERDEIKGDFSIDARGSSVLLVREMQTQNLMVIVGQLLSNPNVAPMLKAAPAIRLLIKSMMIAPDEIVKTDEEIQAALEAQSQNQDPAAADAEAERQFKLQYLDKEYEYKVQIANAHRDTAMMQLAAQGNMKADELRAMLEKQQMANDSKERIFASEAAMTQANPGSAGNGGYI